MKHVTIEVRDGCAEIVTVPPGVTVTVRDFDVIDLDNERLERIDGELCHVQEESGADEPQIEGGQNRREKNLFDLLLLGLEEDGEHHKQWALYEALKLVNPAGAEEYAR